MAHWRIVSNSYPWQQRRDVWIGIRRDDGQQEVARITMQPVRPTEEVEATLKEPIYDLDGECFLQACLNHAWEIGLRPTGFHDTTEQVKAIRDHLADMRTLVFRDRS